MKYSKTWLIILVGAVALTGLISPSRAQGPDMAHPPDLDGSGGKQPQVVVGGNGIPGPPGPAGPPGPQGAQGEPGPVVERVVVRGEVRYVVRDRRGLSDRQILAYVARLRTGTGAHRFSNSDQPPGYAAGSVQNQLRGYPDGAKRPNWPMSRAEGAVVAERTLDASLDASKDYTDKEVGKGRQAREAGDNALWAAISGLPNWWGVLGAILATLAILGLCWLLWRWLTGRHDHGGARTVGAPHNGLLNAPFGGRGGGATSPTGRMVI